MKIAQELRKSYRVLNYGKQRVPPEATVNDTAHRSSIPSLIENSRSSAFVGNFRSKEAVHLFSPSWVLVTGKRSPVPHLICIVRCSIRPSTADKTCYRMNDVFLATSRDCGEGGLETDDLVLVLGERWTGHGMTTREESLKLDNRP